MKRIISAIVAATALTLALPVFSASALSVPSAPPLERPIVDQANILTDEQTSSLANQINQSRQTKSYQIGILILQSLEGESLEEYSIRVAREWGIGEREKNNGVLMLVSIDDRVMRIEVGSGLEGDLTDARARRIRDNAILPSFREGQYFRGLQLGLSEIHNAVLGRPETSVTTRASNIESGVEALLSFLIIGGATIFTWLGSVLGRSKSWWAGGVLGALIGVALCYIFGFVLLSILSAVFLTLIGLAFDYFVSKNYRKYVSAGGSIPWWIGGGSGGFGGGSSGGGSFGGGGFSGGGASGRW